MKMKSISLVMAGILAASALAGCGNQSQASEGKGSETAETKKLVVWGGVPGEDGPDKIVEDWNKQHPEVQAEYVRFVNDDTGNTKLDTALQSGEQIDIFFTYSPDLMVKRASSGMLEDLENLGAKEFVDENILGGEESFLRVNNKIYGIPTVSSRVTKTVATNLKNVSVPFNF